ncbi:MAG: peptide chain release factor N(5)-glutamine methyltransferase, partial [Paracoccaceae bacterium]|nr:peptide chain release factor N(5)-glutamine methyltransferase [Paracoccaceae bacterium]
LIFEIGPTQGAAVTALMKDAGFADIRVIPDLDGRDRVVAGYFAKTAA